MLRYGDRAAAPGPCSSYNAWSQTGGLWGCHPGRALRRPHQPGGAKRHDRPDGPLQSAGYASALAGNLPLWPGPWWVLVASIPESAPPIAIPPVAAWGRPLSYWLLSGKRVP